MWIDDDEQHTSDEAATSGDDILKRLEHRDERVVDGLPLTPKIKQSFKSLRSGLSEAKQETKTWSRHLTVSTLVFSRKSAS